MPRNSFQYAWVLGIKLSNTTVYTLLKEYVTRTLVLDHLEFLRCHGKQMLNLHCRRFLFCPRSMQHMSFILKCWKSAHMQNIQPLQKINNPWKEPVGTQKAKLIMMWRKKNFNKQTEKWLNENKKWKLQRCLWVKNKPTWKTKPGKSTLTWNRFNRLVIIKERINELKSIPSKPPRMVPRVIKDEDRMSPTYLQQEFQETD